MTVEAADGRVSAAGEESLRILLTTDAVGGVWTYTEELVRALSARGHQTLLAVLGPEDAPEPVDTALATLPGVRTERGRFPLEWMERPWREVHAAGGWLLELARDFAPDVVHLNGFTHAVRDFDAPVTVVAHSDVLTWWRAVHGTPAPDRWEGYRRAVRAGLDGADTVVAPTRAMLEALQREHGPVPAGRVIPNGRRPDLFARAAEKEPVVLGCGRLWDEAKNLRTLDRAARDLAWPVEIAGPVRGPSSSAVGPAHARALGVLTPAEVAERMGGAAVLAHPARYEPFGLVPLEAALAGCALVLGDIPSLREVWGDTATYVSPDDPVALTTVLERLLEDRYLRRGLARRARQRALQLGPDRMADAYLALYRSLRERRAAAAGPAPDPAEDAA